MSRANPLQAYERLNEVPASDPLEDTARVLTWLEDAFQWFLRVGESGKAGVLLPVISELTQEREALLATLLQTAQEQEAREILGVKPGG